MEHAPVPFLNGPDHYAHTQVPAEGFLPAAKVRVVARNRPSCLPNYKCSHCVTVAAFLDEDCECVYTTLT